MRCESSSFLIAVRLLLHIWKNALARGGRNRTSRGYSRGRISRQQKGKSTTFSRLCALCRPATTADLSLHGTRCPLPSFRVPARARGGSDRLTTKALGVVGWVHELVREADETSASDNRTLAPYSSAFLARTYARTLTHSELQRAHPTLY